MIAHSIEEIDLERKDERDGFTVMGEGREMMQRRRDGVMEDLAVEMDPTLAHKQSLALTLFRCFPESIATINIIRQSFTSASRVSK